MGDEEDKETVFQEAAKRAWVRVFIREAAKKGLVFSAARASALSQMPPRCSLQHARLNTFVAIGGEQAKGSSRL